MTLDKHTQVVVAKKAYFQDSKKLERLNMRFRGSQFFENDPQLERISDFPIGGILLVPTENAPFNFVIAR